MDIQAYFDRIGYTGDNDPTLDTLRRIHRAHLMAIPFENLNIHIPRPIILDEDALFEKMVVQGRGGFCFEQNGFFHAVLKQLGFDVVRLEANVHNEGNDFGVPMNHMCLLVTIDGIRYLADVGFGTSFIEPLETDNPDIQVQDVGRFRISIEGDTAYYYLQEIGENEMSLGYRFFFEPHELSDYAAACHYMQTSPKTHFTQKRVCSRWADQGRITVSENKFIVTTWDGQRTETLIETEDQFHTLLKAQFGIEVRTHPPGTKPVQ